MSHTYHVYTFTEGGLKKTYRHWHTLKGEVLHAALLTEDPIKVTCPGCLEYLKRPRN